MTTQIISLLPGDNPGMGADAIIGIGTNDGNDSIAIPRTLPVLTIRNMVVFPGTVVPLSIRRKASLKLLDDVLPENKIIGLTTQRDPGIDEPTPNDVYNMGTASMILKMIRQADDTVLLVVQSLQRIAIVKVIDTDPYIRAEIEVCESSPLPKGDKQFEAMYRNLRETALKLVESGRELPEQTRVLIMNISDPGQLADFIASSLSIDSAQKQDLLEELDVFKRIRAVQQLISNQLEIAQLQQKLQEDVVSHINDSQRRAYLHEQMQAIQRELGESGSGGEEQVGLLRKRLESSKPPSEVMDQAERELKRLSYVPMASPEYSVIVSYIEILADLPWSKLSEDNMDLDQAEKILNRDHYDLEKVKRRLLEFLAVRKLNPMGHGPILCFLGPPGVGKTSLGQSIADALGRKFTRISLGGIRDEAEIRGHRRTYIGAMPGRIIQELRRVGTRNPVMILDEVDKIGSDFRGDPASALLEVLDPRQNNTFVDRYLDVPFDLSQVIFIATTNFMDTVPPALRDRMEVVELPGYTAHEKLEIALHYLVPRQCQENGLKPDQCVWTPGAINKIIDDYTHEAGVRELERQIGSVCRAFAARVVRQKSFDAHVIPQRIPEILGPAKYIPEMRLKTSKPGVVTGLAYTPYGGEILHVEATRYPGKGDVMLTGQIGNVMKESAQAALSLVRSRVEPLGISVDAFKDTDIHIHVPSGAVPKDGPSAGVAIFTAIASLFTRTPVRSDVAMTGEITLRGLILPIGGLKEKSLAAMRAGINTVIIPRLNEKDLPEIPDEAKGKLKFVLADTVEELLAASLELSPNLVTAG